MTELTDFQRNIRALLPDVSLSFNEPLSKHTTLHIGGGAEVMAFPASVEQLRQCRLASPNHRILGAGSNILAPDKGLDGLTVCLKDALAGVERLDETHIRVMAGTTMARAAVFAAEQGLSGLEFAHGIPGTVGGGIYMNAGAYGGELVQVVETVTVMAADGSLLEKTNAQMGFSYRHSALEGSDEVAVAAVFRLTPGEPETIRAKMKQLQGKRMASQPLNLPSAGSAFKRPQDGYAAALIDGAGLKGFQIGGAAISEKHAGFAVNLGGATAADFLALLQTVSDRVYAASGIRLEPEIRLWQK